MKKEFVHQKAEQTLFYTIPDGNRTHINRVGVCYRIHWTTGTNKQNTAFKILSHGIFYRNNKYSVFSWFYAQ